MPIDWMDARESGGTTSSDDADTPQGAAAFGDAPELLEGLNDAQSVAVVHGEGPLLILAGAGSGKTRVITRRIAWLVSTGRVRPGELCAITFTNKAAKEMRARVEALLPEQARGMWISTFHALCARILRRDIEVLGAWTRDFSIYDTTDRNQLLKSITKDLGFDAQRFRPGLLGAWISERKIGDVTRESSWEAGGSLEDEVYAKVGARYDEAMRQNNALDFDDLLVRVLEIFEKEPGVRDAYASRFRHVLVDEYQDTNRIQYLLTRHLASWHGNLGVCGDPDQSIYAWRGADIRNILDFERDFGSGERGCAVAKLEQNYRSTECILKAAQAVIRNNLGRKEKDLWTDKRTDELIQVLECADEDDEAREIALQIHSLIAAGRKPDDIAIFYRVNFMQRALERGLRLAGVPYQIVGGVEFYQRREIRDLVSYLQLLVNPADDIACLRVVNVPARGIGATSLARLQEWAREEQVSLVSASADERSRVAIRGRAKAGLAAFAGLMERLEGLSERPAAEALERVLDETEFIDWLGHSSDPDVATREENVEELRTHAQRYDRENPEAGLRGFLQEVALVSDVDGLDETEPRVALMTLHASKGLEFPVVFITGLEEELLPHALAMADGETEDEGAEEERRLFYVGMTRARERLFMTHTQQRMHFGETSFRRPSRFLRELPKELVDGHEESEASEDRVLGEWEAPQGSDQLSVGARVEHDSFGYGRVERLQGAGVNARVTVFFDTVGSKVLLVQYARLKVLGT